MARARKKKAPTKKKQTSANKPSSSDMKREEGQDPDEESEEQQEAALAAGKKKEGKKSNGEEVKAEEIKGSPDKKQGKSGTKNGRKVTFEPISELPDEDGENDITSIYDIDGEGPVDLTKLEQKQGKGKWIALIVAALFVLAGAAYLGYRVFNQDFGSPTMTGEVHFAVDVGEDKVASGDLVSIEVEYENRRNVEIDGQIEIFYPDGFYFQSASVEPDAENNRLFELGTIQPGTGGTIRITGQMVGVKGEEKEISGLMTYQPVNFSNDFQETSKASVEITSSIVELTLDAPSQVQSGQEMTYTAEFTNTAKIPLNNVKIVIDYPDGFTYSSSNMPIYGSNNEWKVDVLNPNDTQTLEITGVLEGDSGDSKEFHFQLGLIEIDNSYNVQIEQTSLVVVVNPEVELTLTVPDYVSPGEEIEILVGVKNISDVEVEEIIAELAFEGSLFMAETYTFDIIRELKPFNSKERGTALTLAAPDDLSGPQKITLKIPSAVVEGNTVQFPNEQSADLRVRSDFAATAYGYYYDDNLKKVGTGPLPPVVNHETTYIIRWTISTGSSAMDDVSLKTTLPDDVLWKKNADSGIDYDSAKRQVSYTAGSVAANTETQLEFEVGISPTNDDLDALMVLTNSTVVSAVDSVTGEELSKELDRITTDLPNDEGAKGKGVVEGSL